MSGEEEKKASEAAGPQTITFPSHSDYMVHVLIQKAKEMAVEEGDTIDPLFQIESLGQKRFSTAKDDVTGMGETVW
jgi:hypothetical protein